MSMLVICKMCGFEFGAWRPQCTGCGHPTPRQTPPRVNDALGRALRAPRAPKKKREKKLAATACAFCRVRGAKESCATCGARVHGTCRVLHQEAAHAPVHSHP